MHPGSLRLSLGPRSGNALQPKFHVHSLFLSPSRRNINDIIMYKRRRVNLSPVMNNTAAYTPFLQSQQWSAESTSLLQKQLDSMLAT